MRGTKAALATSARKATLVLAALIAWVCSAAVLLLGQTWSRPWLAVVVTGATVALPLLVHRLYARRSGVVWVIPIPAAVVAALSAVVSSGFGVHAVTAGPMTAAARANAVVTVDIRVQSDVRQLPQAAHRAAVAVVDADVVAVRLHHQSWRCATPVRLMMKPSYARVVTWGARLRFIVRARPAHTGERAAAVLTALEPGTLIAPAPAWARAAQRWRAGLRAASGAGEAAALLPALAIGDTTREPQNLIDAMRTTGLSHLSAVSGANVSIVLATVSVLAIALGLRGWLLGVTSLGALVWFVVVARPSPSVLRAAVMGAISLIPLIAGWRRTRGGIDALHALGLASCVLLVLDPWLALSWGFALSFFATLGLLVGVGPVQSWLNSVIDSRAPRLATKFSRIRRWLVSAIAVSMCAQVAVAPVLVLMGARLSWVSLPANVLVEPAVAPATISGLAASAIAQVSPSTAHAVARPGVWATNWIARIAHVASDVSQHDPFHLRAALEHIPFIHRNFPSDTVAVLCNVGQGTALVVPLGGGSAIVDDVGPDPDAIDGCLRHAGVTSIALLILSHFHADHVNGLSGALINRRLGRVLVSPFAEPADGVKFVQEQLQGQAISAESVSVGSRFSVGNADVMVLSPSTVTTSVDSPPNDNCVAITVTLTESWSSNALRILAPCDLEYAGQESLLSANSTLPGSFDVALVPHHGSSKQLEAFAQWARPAIALVPVGAHNDYGHPAEQALTLWGNRGRTQLGRTDTDGDLVIRRCGQRVCLDR